MAVKLNAIKMVAEFIITSDMYSFKSLAEETQRRLITAYGSDFGLEVDRCLGLS